MNKLWMLSYGGGLLAGALSLWAAFSYGGSPFRFVEGMGLAVAAAGLPAGLAHLKATGRSLRRRLADEDAGYSEEQGAVFVSEAAVSDPFDCLEAVVAAVDGDDYDRVERDAFDERPGLTVTYSGFHNCFVRFTDGGRIVVTGASARTHQLAETVAEVCSLSFERTRDNPFAGVEPIRGGPRVFLGVLVFVVVLASVNAAGAAAYPSDAYNPAERVVLVGIDARGDVAPGVSTTDTRLRKAAFLVSVIEEEATEVRWERNDTALIAGHGRQALRVSNDARALLGALRDDSLTPAQAERADRIEAELRDAERAVAAALANRAKSDALDGDVSELRRLGARLQTASSRDIPSARVRAAVRPGPSERSPF